MYGERLFHSSPPFAFLPKVNYFLCTCTTVARMGQGARGLHCSLARPPAAPLFPFDSASSSAFIKASPCFYDYDRCFPVAFIFFSLWLGSVLPPSVFSKLSPTSTTTVVVPSA
jgi:hypothetical protein